MSWDPDTDAWKKRISYTGPPACKTRPVVKNEETPINNPPKEDSPQKIFVYPNVEYQQNTYSFEWLLMIFIIIILLFIYLELRIYKVKLDYLISRLDKDK